VLTRTQRQIEEHRQGVACVEVRDSAGRPCPGVAVWAEQETHAFVFACVAPDLTTLPEPDRPRCRDRLAEVFNRLVPAGRPVAPGMLRVDVPEAVHLGRFVRELDRLSESGLPLDVHVRGRAVGLAGSEIDERAAAERVAELYTLCFAHPAVAVVTWDGVWDGEDAAGGGGLLRRDLAPRTAFRYLHKLIGSVWHSRARGETDTEGQFRFRGFFGDYRVAARLGEGPAAVDVVPWRGGDVPFLLSLHTR
jgi:hypothetical protein